MITRVAVLPLKAIPARHDHQDAGAASGNVCPQSEKRQAVRGRADM